VKIALIIILLLTPVVLYGWAAPGGVEWDSYMIVSHNTNGKTYVYYYKNHTFVGYEEMDVATGYRVGAAGSKQSESQGMSVQEFSEIISFLLGGFTGLGFIFAFKGA
jgi:hypothetical protein